MEGYTTQCKEVLDKAEQAILNGQNVVICGPECSGKTYLQNKLTDLLQKQKYAIYYGMLDFKQHNKLNGKTYLPCNDKFWIEEKDKNNLSDLLNNYEYIETIHQYPRIL